MTFHRADPSSLLTVLHRNLGPEQVVSLPIHCDARSAWEGQDDWFLLQQVLGRPAVYDAFGIRSLPPRIPFHTACGLEVIGTLANLLDPGGRPDGFVNDFEAALSLAREFLDDFFGREYRGAVAYSSHHAWCDWFTGEGILDETIVIRNRHDWWLLAITGTD